MYVGYTPRPVSSLQSSDDIGVWLLFCLNWAVDPATPWQGSAGETDRSGASENR
jgi:hypothetical protein